jgi:hypothetical protein
MHRVHSESLSKQEKRALWDEIIQDYFSSQQSVREYCEIHGLKSDHLSYYVHSHKKKHSSKRFIPVNLGNISTDMFSVEYDSLIIRLPINTPSDFLRQLISDLKASC